MTKVKKPDKEFYESEKKPSYMRIDGKIDEADNNKSYKVSYREDKNFRKRRPKK